MPSRNETVEFWNKEAPLWVEQKPLGNLGPLIKESIRQYIRCLLPMTPKNMPILDLAAGAGTMEYFDEENSNRIITLDSSTEMLSLNRINKKVNSSLDEKLPFKSNSIAFVTSFFSMRYQSEIDHQRILTESARVLLPGGALLLVDVGKNNYPYQKSLFDPNKLGEIMSKIGFESVSIKENNFIAPLNRRLYGPLTSACIKILFGFKPSNHNLKKNNEKLALLYPNRSEQI